MHLKSLKAENVKKLTTVDLRLDAAKPLVVIRGKNASGKSTLIDLPRYLFGGAKTHPPKVIRDGEREAIIEGETDDFTAIRRWWMNADGEEVTELELRATDGSPLKKAQGILDKIFNDLAFDPTALARMKGPEQVEYLKKLTGVDTTPLERAREKLFEDRKLVNRDLANAEGHLKLLPTTAPAPAINVSSLLEEQQKLQLIWARAERAAADRDRADASVKGHVKQIERLEAELAAMRVVHKVALDEYAKVDNAADDAMEAADGVNAKLEGIRAQLAAGQAGAAAWAKWEERQRVAEQVKALASKTDGQTAEIQKLDEQKAALIASAKLPAGIGFGSDGATLNGLPFVQASQAEQIRAGVGLWIAGKPKLRLMGVKEGSLLDEDSIALLEKLCAEHDMMCLFEAVGETGPATLVLVDGAVRP